MKEFFTIALFFLTAPAFAQEEGPPSREAGLAEWDRVYEVLSHPRCANCHVGADNRPRWSGPSYGLAPGQWQYHGMNINGGEDRIGLMTLPCMTCHQTKNSDLPHGPPGSHVWALAPVEMEWFGKDSAAICAQIKDPDRNGGRTIAEVADHISHDELVLWGWAPGPGREPAPGSADLTAAAVLAWEKAGAPCPGDMTPAEEEE